MVINDVIEKHWRSCPSRKIQITHPRCWPLQNLLSQNQIDLPMTGGYDPSAHLTA
jgi:hypothetical protein